MKKKILIVRLSALGDVLFTLPALRRLRAKEPDASITWVVEDKAAAILEAASDLDHAIIYPRKAINRSMRNPLRWPRLVFEIARHFRRLRRERYDVIYDMQGNLKGSVHVLLARGNRKVGFAKGFVKEKNHLFTHEHVTPPPYAVHRIEKIVSLVEPTFEPGSIVRPDLLLPPAVVEEARRALGETVPGDGRLLVVHPGTSEFGAFKRWAPEKFGRLAGRLRQEEGFSTMVTWGPGEQPLAEQVARAGGEGVFLAPPSPSLLHLAAYIRIGEAYVSADSGPLHLANYLGVPCLALFGPKDPALYRPYFPPAATVRKEVECSPCSRRHCDDPICMERLDVDEVYEALLELLGSGLS
jgi:ADP-heptose:LPS heptosyltransferase